MKEEYAIRKIENSEATEFQKTRHYLKRKSNAVYSFGLYEKNNLIGVCIFGIPASPTLCKGIAGEDEKHNVLELNRLWIKDDTPQNTESWFVSRCLKQLKLYTTRDIIVSFADTSQNHKGIIYQALSFHYTGLTKARRDRHIKDKGTHGRDTYRKYTLKQLEAMGIEMEWKIRPQKHRYIKFLGSKTRKKELRKKLKYKIVPYP